MFMILVLASHLTTQRNKTQSSDSSQIVKYPCESVLRLASRVTYLNPLQNTTQPVDAGVDAA